jgi:hypothetical protein
MPYGAIAGLCPAHTEYLGFGQGMTVDDEADIEKWFKCA